MDILMKYCSCFAPESNSASDNDNQKAHSVKVSGKDIEKNNTAEMKTIHEDSSFKYFNTWKSLTEIEWKSPTEIHQNAVFVDSTFVFDDVDQGNLGDCWFLASIGSVLEECPEKLHTCIPKTTNFNSTDYNGKLEFVFYDLGTPTKVVINDKLPTKNGRLIFANSNQSNEYWTALIEKAFAVFQGGYDKIEGGQAAEGLQCLADMITQTVELKDVTDFELKRYVDLGVACCASSNRGSDTEIVDGIVLGHEWWSKLVENAKSMFFVYFLNYRF